MKWFSPENLEYILRLLWGDLIPLFNAVDGDIDDINDRIDSIESGAVSVTTSDGALIITNTASDGGE